MTEKPNGMPLADQGVSDDQEINGRLNLLATKVQKVLMVEEVRETMATALEKV